MSTSEKNDFVKPPPMPGSHVYDGYRFPAPFRAANFDAMKTWKVREDDIFCITYAKSGTHWIFEIVSLIINGGDPSIIERSHMGMTPEISMVSKGSQFNNLEAIEAAEPGYKNIDTWESPRVIPTHMHERFFPPDAWEKKVKMIYLGRNFKDVLCSTWAFASALLPPERKNFDNFVKFQLMSDEVSMGPWFDHVKGYVKHHNDDQFLFLRYEDLQKDLVGQVKKIATFLGRPISDAQAENVAHLSTMDQMKKTYDKHEKEDPNGIMNTRRLGMLKFLNKGKVGNWKDKITGDLNELFDKVYTEKMADAGVEFEFDI